VTEEPKWREQDEEHHEHTDDPEYEAFVERQLSRGQLLKRAGAGAAVLAGGSLLGAPGALARAGRGARDDEEARHLANIGAQVNKILKPKGPKGRGIKFDIGAVLALTGTGSFYGDTMSKGTNLAVKHIKAAGGPNFHIIYKDHKSGNPEAGATATRELGIAKVSAVLASYLADFGAMLPGLAQSKMLALDGGGGTGLAFQGKPFFWGTRAITPDDTFFGDYRYIKQKLPSAKRVAFVIWDAGAPFVNSEEANLKKVLPQFGLQHVGTEPVPIGANDYSNAIARVKALNPDIIQMAIWGTDPGYFMRGYVNSGIKAQVVGSEFTPDAAKIAGSAYDQYWFAFDYFDAKNPPNPFSKLFVQEYRKAYGSDPFFYAADFYENTFAFWDLIRRVLAKKGNIKSGPQLQAALVANPVFKSVYAGSKTTVGTYTLSRTTHSTSHRQMGLFQVKGGTAIPLALYDIGGKNFRVVA
jgi:branched-chain amino acid transport system substrate-binding protein